MKDSTFFAVNYLAAAAFEGEDAEAFLQGQLTADVAALPKGRWARAAYCSPQGRALATMILARRDGGFVALLAADLADDIVSRLSRFVMRSKVRIAKIPAAIDARLGEDSSPPAFFGGEVGDENGAMMFDEGGGACLRLQADVAPGEGAGDAWRRMQIERGIPWIEKATSGVFVPQYVNWESLGGINFRKGCYVGQEIIARLYYLGKVKRRGYIVRGVGGAPEGKLGDAEVVNAAEDGGEFVALVSAPRALGDSGENIQWDGRTAAVSPPPYPIPTAAEDSKPRPKV